MTSSPGPWQLACPVCGSVQVRRNVNDETPQSTTTHDYHCGACHATFDEPVDRKAEAVV